MSEREGRARSLARALTIGPLLALCSCSPPRPPPVQGTLFGVSRHFCIEASLSGGDLVSSSMNECTPMSPLERVAGRSDDGWFVTFTDSELGQRQLFSSAGAVLATASSSLTAFVGLEGRWFGVASNTVQVSDGGPFKAILTATPGSQYLDIGAVGGKLVVLELDASRNAVLREYSLSGDALVAERTLELPLLKDAVRIAETDATSVLLAERSREFWARVALDGSSSNVWIPGTQACLGGNALHSLWAGSLRRLADGVSTQTDLAATDGLVCTCDPDRVLLLRGASVVAFDWKTQLETVLPSDINLTSPMLLRCEP